VPLWIKNEKSLIQQDINGVLASTIQNELAQSLPDSRSCCIDELLCLLWGSDVDMRFAPDAR